MLHRSAWHVSTKVFELTYINSACDKYAVLSLNYREWIIYFPWTGFNDNFNILLSIPSRCLAVTV